jgi:hypothetical protein
MAWHARPAVVPACVSLSSELHSKVIFSSSIGKGTPHAQGGVAAPLPLAETPPSRFIRKRAGGRSLGRRIQEGPVPSCRCIRRPTPFPTSPQASELALALQGQSREPFDIRQSLCAPFCSHLTRFCASRWQHSQ